MRKTGLIIFTLAALVFKGQVDTFYTKIGSSGIDIGYSVKQTLEGNYIIAGSTTGFGAGNSDIYLIKLDSTGSLIWQRTLGGFSNDVGKSIIQLSDSGYVIAGFTNSYGNGGYDAFLTRTDKFGNEIWIKTFGGLDWDFGYDLIQTSDGNIVLCGTTTSFGNGKQDAFVVKYDLSGNILWQKFYGGAEDDEFRSVYSDNGSDIYVAGTTRSYSEPNGDMYAFKLNSNGDSLLRIIYGGSLYDNGNSIVVNSIGEIFIAGGTESFSSGKLDAMIVKFSPSGTYVTNGITGTVNQDEQFFKVINSNSGFGELIAIYSEDQNIGTGLDFVTIALNNALFYVSGGKSGTFGFTKEEEPYDICPTKDKGYAQVGYTKSLNAIDKDMFFVKRDSMLRYGELMVNIKEKSSEDKITFFPNPVVNQSYLTILKEGIFASKKYDALIFNLSGDLIINETIGTNETKVDLSSLPKGIYILNIKNSKENYHFKILKL